VNSLSQRELARGQWDSLYSLASRGLSKSTDPWTAPWGDVYDHIEGVVNYGEYVFLNRPARHHAEMLESVMDAIYRRENTVVLEPRGAAKTTWCNTTLGAWLTGEYPDIRIGLISNTSLQANDFSRAIRWTHESNDRSKQVFGDLYSPTKWTNQEWLRKGSKLHSTKDVTMFAQGVGGAIISKRFDIILCDDILDDENTETPEAREKVETWFLQTLLPCLAPDGVVIVIGTRWAEGDLYELLTTSVSKGGKGWKLKTQPAVLESDEGSQYSYWPEYWPMERLDKVRGDLGTAMFMCAYQNDIRGLLEGNIFRAADWQHDSFYFQELPPGKYTIRMGVDLASSEKQRADFTARGTVAEDDRGDFWILSVYRDKREAGHAEFIYDGWLVYPNMDLVRVENQQFQSTLVQEVMEDYPYIPIEGIRSDVDKVTRARAVAAKYEAHKVHHHISLKGGDYEMELLGFPKGHDDQIDAIGFAMDLGGGGGLTFASARR
jgi:predicted phage terminase large subunit-like protein